MRITDESAGISGCSDPNYCLNGKPKPNTPTPISSSKKSSHGDNWWANDSSLTWWVNAGAGFSPTQPGWHNYGVGPDLACPAIDNCTQPEMIDYLSRFAYPGQNPSKPVVNGQRYSVNFPGTNISMGPLGAIRANVLNSGLTVYNQTLKTHIFYNGVAVRTVFQGVDGGWYVETHSYGNNVYQTAGINQSQGPGIFTALDQQMLNDVEEHH